MVFGLFAVRCGGALPFAVFMVLSFLIRTVGRGLGGFL